eukprot:Gb_32405 [translate_table: standard]
MVTGSMEHHIFHSNGESTHTFQEQRYSISDVDNEAFSDCAGISRGLKKGENVDDSAESDLDSHRLLVQKKLSQDISSEHSSPDKNSFTGTNDSKGSIQYGNTQGISTSDTIKPLACVSKECQTRKLHSRVDGYSEGSSSSFLEYDDLLKGSAVISTPNRFKERKRPASMDLIAEINSRDGYNNSPKIGNNSTLRTDQTRRIENEKTMHSSLNHSDYSNKEDWQKKRNDSQGSASGKLRTFPSPGTPSRHGLSAASSWSLERVSMAANAYRNGSLAQKYIPGQSMNMKSLPSKWDDAEKWLCSPASTDTPTNALQKNGDYPRRPKSKSGPLAVLGPGSPSTPLYYARRGSAQAFHVSSPRNAHENWVTEPGKCGVATVFDKLQEQKISENIALHINGRDSKLAKPDSGGKSYIMRSASVDGWSFQAKQIIPRIEMGSEVPASVKEPAKLEDYIPELCEENKGNADTQINPLKSRTRREVNLPVPTFTDMFTQDKYADTVNETPRLYGSTSSHEEEIIVVQTPKHEKWGSSMKDAATEISPTVSRRDMATQITPLGSSRTSRCTTPQKNNSPARHNTPARRSASGNNSTLNLLELQTCHLAKLEIQDNPNQPEVITTPGKRVISSWSTREEEEEESSKCLRYFETGDWKKNIIEARATAWEEAERSKCLARFKREEAKITAWENHQKAKAEAELKKLEVKLEKLRSHSTEKIMNKLSSAHKKAEDMRVTLAANQAEQMAKTFDRAACIRITGHVGTLGACFSCNV